ncbi:MAG: LptF/LptG family permease, partial [Gemmatimonadota bacterium]|nr:LptF/LptG family permease [Gemmatimonadota bacterium]
RQAARTVYADSGVMAFTDGRTDLLLTLYDGHLREVDVERPELFQTLDFQRQIRTVPGVMNTFQTDSVSTWRSDREMTIAMMEAQIDTLRSNLRTVRGEAYASALRDVERVAGLPLSTPLDEGNPYSGVFSSEPAEAARQAADNLVSSESRDRDLQRQIREFRVEIHKKFSIAAATLVFVLVGAPLAMRFPRGGLGMVITASLLIFCVYYIGLIGGETLADSGYVTPTVAMWVVNVLMFALGLWGVMRMGNELSTSRGGAWDERLEGARSWVESRLFGVDR